MTYPLAKHKMICCLLTGLTLCACEETKTNLETVLPTPPRQDASPKAKLQAPSPSWCPRWNQPKPVGRVTAEKLQEISGVVQGSDRQVLWVHNDSGDEARLYALSLEGKYLGAASLPVPAHDWEDIALKQTGKDRWLYVADSGDNKKQRKNGISIHRFHEPDLDVLQAHAPEGFRVTAWETMKLRYPSGPTDAEALLVDPISDEIVLITKPRMELPVIYSVRGFPQEATLSPHGKITPEKCGELIHLVTAADISPDGRWIVVRTYDDILLFERQPGKSIAKTLQGRACSIPPASELQGEAVGFLRPVPKNTPPLFITIGEGSAQPIYRYAPTSTK